MSNILQPRGPNTTTYTIAAELFPTRYRALSHGISAAFGKLDSVIAHFSVFMLLGLLTTVFYIPTPEIGSDARAIAEVWRWGSKSWDGIVGLIDRDEGERRKELRELKDEKRIRVNEDTNGATEGDANRDWVRSNREGRE
ncbi:hypothetical protein BPOR_0156g00010 [Botrytis porri]|uniref:Major facilitator superfamily (MFS) profile domain-containing protein n=1 Tax=Botrytis porri TaxID=87229 RepID=A0A4Z1KVF7_9HELO|nr:hypothetical protein BPOR_0156g00010 [Botrytis porri]